MKTLVVLTGAGISAESGLSTFRDENGLWCGHRVEDVATPEAFARNPSLVHEFYNMRRAQAALASPNAAHKALASLAKKWPGRFLLVTQNVDGLHERAMADAVPGFTLLAMHGELRKIRCNACETVREWEEELSIAHACDACTTTGHLRPHIVWFGEMPLGMETIESHLTEVDIFISIGTSGQVYPAAGFVRAARAVGAHCVELNMERTPGSSLFHEGHYGPATKIVPEFLSQLVERHA